ncbi:MAG: hypothetical protein FWD57_03575 [Polyangiaceae bacterium]|nr:hypothetical protein [Polyangiaceae bacterium]
MTSIGKQVSRVFKSAILPLMPLLAASAGLLGGCSEATAEVATDACIDGCGGAGEPQPGPIVCSANETQCGSACCDDAVEECINQACELRDLPCVEEGARCSKGMVCNGELECVEGCHIDGVLYDLATPNPQNPCEFCSDKNAGKWSAQGGRSCGHDGGAICDGGGACVTLHGVSTGWNACALTSAGGVMCWGEAWDGDQTFANDEPDAANAFPRPISGLESGVSSVSVGSGHICAVTEQGGVVCWGRNPWGQLGDGTTNDRLVPTPVVGLGSGVSAVAAGLWHTCALTKAGGVKCWGWNVAGQLGNKSTTEMHVPVQVVGLESGVKSIATAAAMSFAVKKDGTLVCWGSNCAGDPKADPTTIDLVPVPVYGFKANVASVSAGIGFACAVLTTGAVKCWGEQATTSGPGTSDIVAVSSDYCDSCALTSSNKILCWEAATCDARTPPHGFPLLPAVITIPSSILSVSTGDGFACAESSSNGIMCWGHNSQGQLGNGTFARSDEPTLVRGY